MESQASPVDVFSSQVHTKSLSTHFTSSGYRQNRLKNCQPEYDAVWQFHSTYSKSPVVERLESCRTNPFFKREISSGKVFIASTSCHVRFCPLCSSARSYSIKQGTASWLKSFQYPKFMTLTLKHSDLSLSEQMDKLYSSFKELRRTKFWKSNVFGGIWFFEVKKSKENLWHPHLHIVLQSNFLSHAEVVKHWRRITTDSTVVDIRAVSSPQATAEYVAKYAVKPAKLTSLQPDTWKEYFDALFKRRLCGTFGSAQKLQVLKKPKRNPDDYQNLGSWSVVVNMCNSDADAHAIMEAYRTGSYLPEGISCSYLDTFITNPMVPDEINPPPDIHEQVESFLFNIRKW